MEINEITLNSDELILKKVEETCKKYLPIKLAVVDYISSTPSIIFLLIIYLLFKNYFLQKKFMY